jgi:hypothetical protein
LFCGIGTIVGIVDVMAGFGILEGAFNDVDGFLWEFAADPGGGEEGLGRIGSVLLRTRFDREGGESVDDCRKPLGFSLEVEGFGFNEGGLGVDDCAVIVVIVPNVGGLIADDGAGLSRIVDYLISRDINMSCSCINSGH